MVASHDPYGKCFSVCPRLGPYAGVAPSSAPGYPFSRDRGRILTISALRVGDGHSSRIVWMQATLEIACPATAEGIDIVGAKVGAAERAGRLFTIWMYRNGNIRLDEVAALRANPMVALPWQMGDSVAGARIVGAGQRLSRVLRAPS